MPNTEPSHARERTPVRLGRYEIVQKLGAGGMADVYLAHQPGPFSASKLIVIKQLRAGLMDDDQTVQMFADESRIAVRLQHPNVVQTYEAVADGRDYYLVLEYLDGKSLFQVLSHATRARMPLPLHLWILTQVLSGLHYAHELKEFDGSSMGIVHRDVSPSNVFVTYTGEVKLLDFGIAKSAGASTSTREGIIKGKLGYAAPEQCLCRAIDRRTDLFAVGVMLWEAIAGRRRPLGETDAVTYQARVQGTEQRIEEAVPAAPPALVAICNRALAHRPEERYQTALEFRQALDRYLQSTGWDDVTSRLYSFMHEHFSADMDETRQRIDEYLGRSRAIGAKWNSAAGHTNLSPAPYQCHEDAGEPGAASLGNARQGVTTWFRKPMTRWTVIAGCAVIGGLGTWLLRTNTAKTADTPLVAVRSSAAPSDSAISSAPQAPVAQRATQITVSLAAKPDRAELRLDGRLLSNPYRAVHGRDEAQHHLAVSLAGYETVEQDIPFNADVDVSVTLRSPTQQRQARSNVSALRTVVSRPTRPRDTKAALPTGTDSPQPGDALRGTKKAQKIDEADPY